MSIDSDDLSTQPLAKLLRDPSIITQSSQPPPGARRKLRPETIEVYRLKDVGSAQPVGCSIRIFIPLELTMNPSPPYPPSPFTLVIPSF